MDVILDFLKDLIGNYMLICAMCGWIVAQIIKIFTGMYEQGTMSIRKVLFSNGGMPSSHTASVIGLTTAALLQHGVGSSVFAICAILSIIVVNDAVGVRYETGKQAVLLNKITKKLFSGAPEHKHGLLKELVGHTPLQVFMGAILGIGVAIALYFIML